MKPAIIAAVAQNGVIGHNNSLIWRLSDDMKLFRKFTTGHHVIMGRKTFESMGSKPLPNRTNVIVSRNLDYEVEGAETAVTLAEALQVAAHAQDETPFIIGGGEIYALSMYLVQVMYISHVHTHAVGDTYFPMIDPAIWKMTEKQSFQRNEKNEFDFDFCTYNRI